MFEVLIGAGFIAAWGGSLWIGRLAALRNENVMALLSAFLPPIAIMYGLNNLKSCWRPLLMTVAGVVILLLNLF